MDLKKLVWLEKPQFDCNLKMINMVDSVIMGSEEARGSRVVKAVKGRQQV